MENLEPRPLSFRNFSSSQKGSPLHSLLDSSFGFSKLNKLYSSALSRSQKEGLNFFDSVLREMDVTLEIDSREIQHIPRDNPLVVVANHPFGGLDGLAMGSILSKARSDFKLLVNSKLNAFDALNPWIQEVQVMNEKESQKNNLVHLLKCARHIKSGKCFGVFPSGQVSSFSFLSRGVSDPVWSEHPFALARMCRATVLPIKFEGRNSLLFQCLGLVHPFLRTSWLARELCNKKGHRLRVLIGEPISNEEIEKFTDARSTTEFARLRVEALQKKDDAVKKSFIPKWSRKKTSQPQRIIEAVEPEDLTREISELPKSRILVSKGNFDIYCIKSCEAPKVMREISRLREKTFRSVGEGTGMSCDTDVFDDWYYQLFAFDRENIAIAGGYRLGVTNEIIREKGKSGMYATSEFSLKRGFFRAIGNSVELGRSFIQEDYQKKFSLLGLLWKAIGEFVNGRPDIYVLYGPVSISADYTQFSKNLLVRFLRLNRWSKEIARRTKAKNQFRFTPLNPALLKWVKQEERRLDEVSAVISAVEPDGKGVPVLVKHYLKLNGLFVGFSVDPGFGDTLDGLIVVDIRNMEDRQLSCYFGEEGKRRIIRAREIRDAKVENSVSFARDRNARGSYAEPSNP